jgi:RNA polymerase sigma-70 factor (ECF subfamily)
MITREVELDLHRLLLEGDPAARSMCAVLFMPPLEAFLRGRYPHLRDEQLYEEAVTEALLQYMLKPTAYAAEKSSLLGYLRMAALGDLRNIMQREKRHSGRWVSLEAVEHLPLVGNEGWDDEPVELPPGISREQVLQELRDVVPDPVEWRVLELLVIEEVRETGPYVAVMGITHLSPAEQAVQVKRMKDKLKVRIKRLGGRLRDNPPS